MRILREKVMPVLFRGGSIRLAMSSKNCRILYVKWVAYGLIK